MQYPGVAATIAKPDHGDYLEVVLPPARHSAATAAAHAIGSTAPPKPAPQLGSAQWQQLLARIKALPNPRVSRRPSASAVRDPQPAANGRH
jgi:hypothetical protein